MKYLLIDGENLRKIATKFLDNKNSFLNFNLSQIIGTEIEDAKFDKIIWYAAKIKEDKNNLLKSKELIDFQRKLFSVLRKQKISIDLSGRIQNIDSVFREKGVDVAIATDMVSFAYEVPNVELYLWSNDSDLIPAIKKIVSKKVKITYITFDGIITKSILFNATSVIILKINRIKEIFRNKNTSGS